MDRAEFFGQVGEQFGVSHLGRISEAYQLSKALHRPQSRKTGERYFEHPRAVALILMDFAPATVDEIVMALLHDSIEDCYILPGIIGRLFGDRVMTGVAALTKCKIMLSYDGEIQKIDVSADDYWQGIREADRHVRRVKLADRLHNLRSMATLSESHQRKQIDETRMMILPIAYATDKRFYGALDEACRTLERSLIKA
jgi:GTP pyrophosphokinase